MRATLHILEKFEDMEAVEELQRIVWPGSELDIVPAHMLMAASHNGGLVIGAFTDEFVSTFEQAANFAARKTRYIDWPERPPRRLMCPKRLSLHPQLESCGKDRLISA